MDKVRLAIVGCGNISQMNGPGYIQHPNCEVYALCDPAPGRAEERAKQWGITPRIFTSYETVLNDPNIDAVELLTPTHLHAEQIIAALNAGKHVSCQKPMCTTVAEADAIIAAAGAAKTKFRVTENFLYYPPIIKAKELLDAGAIGEPSLVRFHTGRVGGIQTPMVGRDPEAFIWRRDPQLNPGGLIFDDGVHKYALAMKWIGDIEKVQGIVGKTKDFHLEAPSAVVWKFQARDCLGILDYTHHAHMIIRGKYTPVDEFYEIHGSEGIIWVTRCTSEMLDLPPVVLMRGTETVSYQTPMDFSESFKGAAWDFIDSILQDGQPGLDAQFSKKVLLVALAIYEAARTERPVDPQSIR
jgi:predicted dehydrogenase